MKLFRVWPRPPEMSEARYTKYRFGLVAGIVLWVVCFGGFVFFLGALPVWLRVVVVVALFFVGPDIDAVEQVFTPYKKYKRERGSKGG